MHTSEASSIGSTRRVPSQEHLIFSSHPLRELRQLADEALRTHRSFSKTPLPCSDFSIAPERLLRAALLTALYSVRNVARLAEQMRYNLLWRWFVGLDDDERAWDAPQLAQDLECFLQSTTTGWLLSSIIDSARASGLVEGEHFRIDPTMVQAWTMPRVTADGPVRPGPSMIRLEAAAASPTAVAWRPQDTIVAPATTPSRPQLTGRQLEVLQELSAGKSNRDIAQALGITQGTVKIHLVAIFRVLKVKTRTEAVMLASRAAAG